MYGEFTTLDSLIRKGLLYHREAWGERKRKCAGHDFPSPHHTPRAFYFSITLLLLLGYPTGASLCGRESDFRIKKETGAEIFPAVVSGLNDRTTRRQRNRRFKNEFAFFRSLSRLF